MSIRKKKTQTVPNLADMDMKSKAVALKEHKAAGDENNTTQRPNLKLTLPQNSFMWASTAFTPGITSSPFTMMGVFERFRRAMCKTARSSVKLIFSPENMASREASTLRARA